MDKIVSLCRRRGFVFPSSEIYGGLGSTFDYGHYGVLVKNNIRARWLEAMVQERDDIVLIDSAVILHPRVWEASGHVEGFTDPLVDCRTCKLRFRADRLEDSQCGRKPSKRPGEYSECDLTEPRHFNLMFETTVGPVAEAGARAFLRPETAQGIFINFKNVLQLARRRPPFGIAQVGKSFRNEITPGNFLFRVREFEQMEMEYFVPPAQADQWYRYWIDARFEWYVKYGLRRSRLRVREHGPEERSHYSQGTSDIEYDYPIGWSELEGVANRGDYRSHAPHGVLRHRARVRGPGGHRAVRPVRDRARGQHRAHLRGDARRRLRRGGGGRARAHGASVAPGDRAGEGGRPAADRPGLRDGREGARAVRGAAHRARGRVRRGRRDRPPLPPPGRDRYAVRVHGRRADARRTTRSRSATETRSPRSASRSARWRDGSRTSCGSPGRRRRAKAPSPNGPGSSPAGRRGRPRGCSR